MNIYESYFALRIKFITVYNNPSLDQKFIKHYIKVKYKPFIT